MPALRLGELRHCRDVQTEAFLVNVLREHTLEPGQGRAELGAELSRTLSRGSNHAVEEAVKGLEELRLWEVLVVLIEHADKTLKTVCHAELRWVPVPEELGCLSAEALDECRRHEKPVVVPYRGGQPVDGQPVVPVATGCACEGGHVRGAQAELQVRHCCCL